MGLTERAGLMVRMTLYFVQFTDKTTLGSSSILGIKVSHPPCARRIMKSGTHPTLRPTPISLLLSTSEPALVPCRTPLTPLSWLGTIFYLAYLIFEWPQTLGLQKFPPGKWMACNIFVWSVVLCCHAACTNFAGLCKCQPTKTR